MTAASSGWSYDLTLTFKDASGAPIASQTFLMGYKFLQKPWYLANATTSSFFKWDFTNNETTTDASGQATVK